MLTLHTLGECRIAVAAEPTLVRTLAPDADRLFSLALLLAGERGRAVPRGWIVECLWPELGTAGARRCLRQALYRLRACGVPVGAAADHLCLPAGAVAATFAAVPREGALWSGWRGGTLRLGRCLPGWVPAGDALRAWVEAYRARVEGESRAALAGVIRAVLAGPALRDGDPGPPVDVLARALLELDPAHPEARRLIREGAPVAVREPPAPRYAAVGRQTVPPAAVVTPARAPGDPLATELAERLDRARAGAGGLAAVVGAPGAGASCALAELGRLAAGMRVVRVACAPGGWGDRAGSAAPYGAAVTLVRALLACPGAIGAAPAAVLALRRFAAATGPAVPVGPTAGAAARLLAARVGELGAAVGAERPLLVLVDGAEHADAASLAVLVRAAAVWAAEPVLAAVACAGAWPAAAVPDGVAWGAPGGVTRHTLVAAPRVSDAGVPGGLPRAPAGGRRLAGRP